MQTFHDELSVFSMRHVSVVYKMNNRENNIEP